MDVLLMGRPSWDVLLMGRPSCYGAIYVTVLLSVAAYNTILIHFLPLLHAPVYQPPTPDPRMHLIYQRGPTRT